MIQPPDRPPLNVWRALVLLLSIGVLVATLFSCIAQAAGAGPREPVPTDSGIPANVTTIGGPR